MNPKVELPTYADVEAASHSTSALLPSYRRGRTPSEGDPYIIPARRSRLRALRKRIALDCEMAGLNGGTGTDATTLTVARGIEPAEDHREAFLEAIFQLIQKIKERVRALCEQSNVGEDIRE